MQSTTTAPILTRFNSDLMRLEYDINFNETGTYYLHLRSWAYDHGQNGFFAALNSQEFIYGKPSGTWIIVGARSDWFWKTIGSADWQAAEPVKINVTSRGVKTLLIYRRDPGSKLDRIWLTKNNSRIQTVKSLNLPNPSNFITSGVPQCTFNSKFRRSTVTSGTRYYTDRSYNITGGVPNWMVGRTLIKTPNGDRLNNAASGYLRFNSPLSWWVYVLFDSRASNVPDWLDRGGWEKRTAYRIFTSLSSQPYLQVWRKYFNAGQCVNLGGNYGPGSSTENRSNFVVVYGKSENCGLNAKFNETTIRSGRQYYTDRSYTITGGVPSWMVGRTLIKTPNDERLNNAGSGYMRFTNPVDWYVYVLFDSRASNLPDWLDRGGWERKDEYRISTSLSSQPYLQVWKKRFPAGACVDLGGNYGPGSSTENRSSYVVVYGR
jgi:hypothetical protein